MKKQTKNKPLMLNLSVPIDCTRVYLVILLVVNESGCYASCTL